MNSDHTSQNRPRRRLKPKLIGTVVAVVVVFLLVRMFRSDSATAGESPMFVVRRGPLRISITEAGTIKPRDQVIIKSRVEGRASILSLIAEGTYVKKGDLLIELDAGALTDRLVDQQIRVQNADANFIRAREGLKVVKNQNLSNIEIAQQDTRFAGEDLKHYVEGQYPNDIKEAEGRINIAKEEVVRSKEKLKWSRMLLKDKYISESEMKADELSEKKAILDHELAIDKRNLLRDFTYARRNDELTSAVKQSKMALERVTLKASADEVQAVAELSAKESELAQQRKKLAKLKNQVAYCRITAPAAGQVVYATTAKASWRGNAEPLGEGQQVHERQELIHLPTAGSMIAEIKIHESNLSKVSVGKPVNVTIDAIPDRLFRGRIGRISPLPDAHSMFFNPDLKIYYTQVYLEGDTKALRTGMSCRAEVIIEEHDDAVYVPVQAVSRIGDRHVIYVGKNGRAKARDVTIGLDNNRMVHIINGIEAGEHVLLVPPLDAAAKPQTDNGKQTHADLPSADGKKNAPKANTSKSKGADPAPAKPKAAAPDTGTGGGRRDRGSMTPEQREAMRKRFEKMTPEQREALRKQWQGNRSRGGGDDGAAK